MAEFTKKLSGLNSAARMLFGMALILEKLGSQNMAMDMFKKAIKKSPDNRWLHLHASRLCLKKGQVDMAVTHWKKAAGPEDIGCFIYWLNKTNRMPSFKKPGEDGYTGGNVNYSNITAAVISKPDRAAKDTGLELLEKGKVEGALAVFIKELETERFDPGLLFNTGLALSKLNKHGEALGYYEKAQELGLNSLELLNNKGYSLYNLEKYEEAQTCYELARGLAPGDYTILNNLAACYVKSGHGARAHHFFAAAVQNNPRDAILLNNLAMCLESSGQTGKAMMHYDTALSHCKNGFEKNTVLLNKVNCLIKLKKLREALGACELISVNCDGEFELWATKAELCNELGRTKEAAENYRKALGLTG